MWRASCSKTSRWRLPGIGVRVVGGGERTRHAAVARAGTVRCRCPAVTSGSASPTQDQASPAKATIGVEVEDASYVPVAGRTVRLDADRCRAVAASGVPRARRCRSGTGRTASSAQGRRPTAVTSVWMATTALDRVVPGIAFQPAVGLEQPAGDAIAFGGPPQRLRLGRLGVARHQQRVGADRLALRRLAPVVDVGEAGAPGPKLGRRRGDVDVGLVRALAVREGRDAGRDRRPWRGRCEPARPRASLRGTGSRRPPCARAARAPARGSPRCRRRPTSARR